MNVHYHDGIRRVDPLRRAAEQATKRLEEVLGASADSVSGEWDCAEDERGRPLVTLKLSDRTGSVTGRFHPDELSDVDHLTARLHRLWGDLLQVRSDVQVKQLLDLVQQPTGD